MRNVIVVHRVYDQGDEMLGLFESEVGARACVYEIATRWEGRMLWWPAGHGRWVAQLLVRDFLKGGKFRMLSTRWEIGPREVKP